MNKAIATYALFGALLAAAACGGQGAVGPGAQVPPAASSAPSASASAAAVAPSSSAGPSSSAPSASSAAVVPPPPTEMKAPVQTTMVDDLKALGLDAKKLPPIEKLEPKALRGVMKLMAKSLGVKCADCHQEGDFAATTPQKKIAMHMWDDFVAKLAMADGAPLFCDSCHEGRTTLLDRHDKKALGQWMDDNFVAKLEQKNHKSQECETCHVDMEMHLLAVWSK